MSVFLCLYVRRYQVYQVAILPASLGLKPELVRWGNSVKSIPPLRVPHDPPLIVLRGSGVPGVKGRGVGGENGGLCFPIRVSKAPEPTYIQACVAISSSH